MLLVVPYCRCLYNKKAVLGRPCPFKKEWRSLIICCKDSLFLRYLQIFQTKSYGSTKKMQNIAVCERHSRVAEGAQMKRKSRFSFAFLSFLRNFALTARSFSLCSRKLLGTRQKKEINFFCFTLVFS